MKIGFSVRFGRAVVAGLLAYLAGYDARTDCRRAGSGTLGENNLFYGLSGALVGGGGVWQIRRAFCGGGGSGRGGLGRGRNCSGGRRSQILTHKGT